MIVSFSGLATGLDTSSLIDGLVRLERAPITRLANKTATIDARARKLGTLTTKLDALGAAAKGLDERAKAQPASAQTSDAAVVTARATGGAIPGTYGVVVDSLATSGKVRSDAVAARDAGGLFGSGTLEITVGAGAPITVGVDGATTLDDVAAAINAASGGAQASVLFDGSRYFLRVAGDATGAANALTVVETGVTLGLSSPGNVVTAAADASFRVDGIPMTRATNTVVDAVPGTTLELGAPSLSPVTVTVTRDSAALRERLQAFVDAYNGVGAFVSAEVAYAGTPKGPDSLSSDAALRSVQGRLRGAVVSPVAGLTGRYDTLASIGVKFRNDGSLELDATRVDAALASDPEAIARVLTGASGAMTRVGAVIDDYTDGADGIISGRTKAMETEKRRIRDQMDRLELRIDAYETRLRAQFTALERLSSAMQAQSQQLAALFGKLE